MTTSKAVTAHRIFGIVLSVAVFIAGICLAAGALTIYYGEGDPPYSREAVADTFSTIAVPVFACLLLTAIGFVWEWVSPLPLKKTRVRPDRTAQLSRLRAKKDADAASQDTDDAIAREQTRRRVLITVRTVLILIGAAAFAVYALNGEHYNTTDINTSIIRAMAVLLPCAVIPFGYSVFAVYAIDKSYQREIALLKELPSAATAPDDKVTDNAAPLTIVRIVLLLAATALLLYGFFAGGTADVLTKAINICTECIGLG